MPEALLSDRGANLLSHLMYDISSLLGVTKLNTTAHHPQCDSMVEGLIETLSLSSESTQLLLDHSGKGTFLEHCEHTAISLIILLRGNHLSYSLALTVILQQKQHCFYLRIWNQQKFSIIKRN